MSHATPPAAPAQPPEDMGYRFALLFWRVVAALVKEYAGRANPLVPLAVLAAYLERVHRRMVTLMRRLHTGTMPRLRPRRERPRAAAVPLEGKPPRLRLPRRHGWLAGEIGWAGRGVAAQIAYMLNQPETAALIAASPQAQRMLRPFCHMLGLCVAAVPALPKRVRAKRERPARPRQPRRLTRKEREAILWYPNLEGKPMKLLPKKLPRD